MAPTAPSTPGGGTLPVTGSETSAFTVIAAAAAFLGAVLIAMTRRRRPARHRLK
ncbi:LPXTG cell wall anchor domain-containing protein [Thermobifida fusca]|uniref:LPXTG cell wall anchor domain-containing protein n=1 Tax=Thermobifida fusca TaxID=2021 RepID=UPI00131DC66B|nr:LPXTG cell wall anchor domain-containing protein [Thermobifida fusca]QOS59868.1 LPXTG cell wall anchor domain-containing protein [Thermobifida fusca]